MTTDIKYWASLLAESPIADITEQDLYSISSQLKTLSDWINQNPDPAVAALSDAINNIVKQFNDISDALTDSISPTAVRTDLDVVDDTDF